MAKHTSTTTPVPVSESVREVPAVPSVKTRVQFKEKTMYQCTQCGQEYASLSDGFFRSPHTLLYQEYKGFVPICKQCLLRLHSELNSTLPNKTLALQVMCAVMDLPYFRAQAEKLAVKTPTQCIPAYIKYVRELGSRKSPRALTFMDTIIKDRQELGASFIGLTREQQEEQWDDNSKFNQNYIIDIVGYDPFQDETFSAKDRRYLFNTMAGYCPDSTVGSDSHKLQSIINIVVAQNQVHALDELINKELCKQPENIDESTLAKYTSMKKDMLAAIDKLADNNEISAKTTKAGKGANTLSDRIRSIEQSGFEGIKMNRFDVKTAQAFQQIAEISTRAIFTELAFQENDYSAIIAEQRDLVTELTRKSEILEEQNRILNNELVELRAQLETEEDDDEY